MLPFFPAFQKDELLYSVVARYHRMAGWRSWSATLEALFGRRHVVASHDLPGHLRALCGSLVSAGSCSSAISDLIERWTLIPYYIAAASPTSRQAALSAAADGGGSSHLSLGFAVSCVPRVGALRFCPCCKAEDMASQGFTWWRRSHQLPGTLVCLRHGALLCETPFGFGRIGRHEFLLADDRSCPTSARTLANDSPACLNILQVIARGEDDVLRTGAAVRSTEERRDRLAGAGIMRSQRRVDQAKLLERATVFFAPAAAFLPGTLSPEALASWMPGLVRSARSGTHPLLHVLMDVFINAQPHVASTTIGPFGAGPWPCFNPLASHTGEKVVVDLSSYVTRGRLVARFLCSCGYVYSRSLRADGKMTKPKFYRYGPLFEPEFRRLISEDASLRAVGRALEIDPKTVVAEAKRLGLAVTWSTASNVGARASRLAVPISACHAPAVRPRRVPAPRLDWIARDLEIFGKCSQAVAMLMKLEPPCRLTYASVERAAVGRIGWIRARSRHLPETISFLQSTVERVDAYKTRRAAFQIRLIDGAVLPWRVMRAAGLKGVDLPMIERLIENERREALSISI